MVFVPAFLLFMEQPPRLRPQKIAIARSRNASANRSLVKAQKDD
jgi:hypothetical protein